MKDSNRSCKEEIMKVPKVISRWFEKLGYNDLAIIDRRDGFSFLCWSSHPIFDRCYYRICWETEKTNGMTEDEFLQFFCELVGGREFVDFWDFFMTDVLYKFPKDIIELKIFEEIDGDK